MKFATASVYTTLLAATVLAGARPLTQREQAEDAFARSEDSEMTTRGADLAELEERFFFLAPLIGGIAKLAAKAAAKRKAAKEAKARAIANGTAPPPKAKKNKKEKKQRGGKKHKRELDLESEWEEEFARSSELEDLVERFFDEAFEELLEARSEDLGASLDDLE